MENNEQLNQNSILNEGIENEQITPKAKKAIDANEKKKIVKLIQPSILPGKVRIEVETLATEAPAEVATPMPPQDETLPEMEAVADVELDEDEEVVEDSTELDALKKP